MVLLNFLVLWYYIISVPFISDRSQAQNQILIVFILRSIISLRSESCPIRSKLIKGPLGQCYVIIFLKHVFIIIIIIYIKCGMCWLFTCMANLKNAVTYFLTYVIEKYVVLIWLLNICTCIFSWSVSHYAFLLLHHCSLSSLISTSLSSSSHQTSSLELKSGFYMLIYSQYCNIARLVCPKNHTYPLIKV